MWGGQTHRLTHIHVLNEYVPGHRRGSANDPRLGVEENWSTNIHPLPNDLSRGGGRVFGSPFGKVSHPNETPKPGPTSMRPLSGGGLPIK